MNPLAPTPARRRCEGSWWSLMTYRRTGPTRIDLVKRVGGQAGEKKRKREDSSGATPAEAQKSLKRQAQDDRREGKHVWGKTNERRSDPASQCSLAKTLLRTVSRSRRAAGSGLWEKKTGSAGRREASFEDLLSYIAFVDQKTGPSEAEGELFRHGGNQKVIRGTSGWLGCDRGFILAKREFTRPHFFVRAGGLRSAGSAR